MPITATEVLEKLEQPPLRKVGPEENYVRFRLSPDVTIAIGASVKRPGEKMVSEPTELKVVHYPDGDEMHPYERLLADAMMGDGTLFARQDGVEAAWQIVDPILGDVTPVYEYQPGTWGPPDAARLTQDVAGWHSPS
jgi:glucose-6-phosphate 1-dehydrogenase